MEESGDELSPLFPVLQDARGAWLRLGRGRWLAFVAAAALAACCLGSYAIGFHFSPLKRPSAASAGAVTGAGAGELAAISRASLGPGRKYFDEDQYDLVRSSVGHLLDVGAKSIAVACFSPRLLDMTNNWICSLASNPANVEKAAVLLLAMDGGCEGVARGFEDAGGTFLCVPVTTKDPPTGPVSYQSERYIFMCSAKLTLFSWAMQAADRRGRGLWFLFSDVDIVVRGDAFGYLESHLSSPDLLASQWPSPNRPELIFQRAVANVSNFNTGFYFARTGMVALRMFQGAMEFLEANRSSDGADQGAVHGFLVSTKEAEKWPVGFLPDSLFPTGAVYFFSNGSNASDDWIALHANYFRSSETKVLCLKRSGNWFLDETAASNNTCVDSERSKNWIFIHYDSPPGGPCFYFDRDSED